MRLLLLNILIVTATTGYRHESIPVAEQVLAELAEEQGIDLLFARSEEEVRGRLTEEELAPISAVFFVNTTGELPAETSATVVVDDGTHAATRELPATHELYEEFYYLSRVDPSRVRMLLSLRARPEPPGDAGYYPLAWEKAFGSGRVFYTALGHREDVWRSEWFRAHMRGAMQWAVSPAQPRRRAVRR